MFRVFSILLFNMGRIFGLVGMQMTFGAIKKEVSKFQRTLLASCDHGLSSRSIKRSTSYWGAMKAPRFSANSLSLCYLTMELQGS